MERLHTAASIHVFFPGSLLKPFFSTTEKDLKKTSSNDSKTPTIQSVSQLCRPEQQPEGTLEQTLARASSAMTTHVFCTSPPYINLLL